VPAASKQRIEEVARDLMARRGYHGMGLKAVSDAAHLPYGSIYHHFPGGKEEIAAAAIVVSGDLIGGLMEALFAGTPPPDAVRAMFDFMAGRLEASDWAEGCAIGTPALDGGDDSAVVREACEHAFGRMIAAVAAGLTAAGRPADEAHALATTVIATYEGATMLARVQRSRAPLDDAARTLLTLLG
jgi:TetR/AcrR family transcriptional repressor of lmrAB and yxaGH operons